MRVLFRYNFRSLLAGLCICALLTSCETTHDVWLDDMQGVLDYNIPAAMGKSQPVVFTAGGITTPSQGIIYEWQAPGFSPSTFIGQSFPTTTPAESGDYPVTVTVKSTGYHDLSARRMIAVQSCTVLPGKLDFSIPAQVAKGQSLTFSATGINSSVGTVTYTWDAPNFDPATATGNTFTAVSPATPNGYLVTVTATADNYCDTAASKLVNVVGGIDMKTGSSLNVVAPDVVYQDHKTTFLADFTAGGDNPPAEDQITYTWECESCNPKTGQGKQYTLTTPMIAGQIILTASAPGYNSVNTSYSFEPQCKPMPSTDPGFYTATKVNINAATSFTAIASTDISGVSYTWNASGLSITGYAENNRIMYAKAPGVTSTVPVILRMEAPGYCPATYTQNISVTTCTQIPTPEITPTYSGPLNSHHTYTFNASNVGVSDATYDWSLPGFSPPTATNTRTFTTVAPAYNPGNTTYTLLLKVSAPGDAHCEAISELNFTVASYSGVMGGTVTISEAITPDKMTGSTTRNHPSVWLAQNHPVTLTAKYKPSTATGDNDVVYYDWYLGSTETPLPNTVGSPIGTDGSITFTPTDLKTNGLLIVKVRPKEDGRAPKDEYFSYDVQDCSYYTANTYTANTYTGSNDLFIDINHQCVPRTEGISIYQSYIKDARDGRIYRIVRMPMGGSKYKWWFAENLKHPNGDWEDIDDKHKEVYGIYYKYNSLDGMNDPAKNLYCPIGWRTPNGTEWDNMITAVTAGGLTSGAGIALKSHGPTISGTAASGDMPEKRWRQYATANGMDNFGFTVYPASRLENTTNKPESPAENAHFISNDGNARIFTYNGTGVSNTEPMDAAYKYTIRCIKEE